MIIKNDDVRRASMDLIGLYQNQIELIFNQLEDFDILNA